MAILWCGGEDIDFPNGASLSTITTSSYFRSGYARGYLYNPNGNYIGRSNNFAGGAITSGWIAARCYANSINAKSYLLLGLVKDYTTNSGLYIGFNASTNGKLDLFKYDGTTKTSLASESGVSIGNGKYLISMQVTDYGASATVKVYVGNTEIISYSGDVTVTGVTSLSAAAVGAAHNAVGSGAYLSEIIVSTTDARNMSLVTLYPNGAGDTLDWTGAYTTVDELACDDSDLAYDNTDGNQAMYNLSASPAGTFSVLAVKETVRACRASDSTPTSLDIGIKSGGSVDVNDNHALAAVWTTYERLMTSNPVTSAAFTTSELDAMQIVLESEA